VFLAFDMEMLLMYPWTLVVSRAGVAAVIEMFLFLGILPASVFRSPRRPTLPLWRGAEQLLAATGSAVRTAVAPRRRRRIAEAAQGAGSCPTDP
jgi:hypothetical protein